jgi:hypothetical protein
MWALAVLFGLFAITIVYIHEAQIDGWFSLGSWWALAGATVSLGACAMFVAIALGDVRLMRDLRKVYDVDSSPMRLGEVNFLPKLPPDFVRILPSDKQTYVRIPPSDERVPFIHVPVDGPRTEPEKPD